MGSDQTFPSDFGGLLKLIGHLRGPDGCPWDREQTRESLKRFLLEECYELMEAIDAGDSDQIGEELGDVSMHIASQMRIGMETGELTEDQVFGGLIDKLIRRHPHVFGDATAADGREVEANWQALKQRERDESGGSILDGAPRSMPALGYAQAIQERAAWIGFDWEDVEGVLAKVSEELDELREAPSREEKEWEIGDLLFSLVNVCRWLDLDAEGALRKASARFFDRFTRMESGARERGEQLAALSLDRKEALWQEAKRMETQR